MDKIINGGMGSFLNPPTHPEHIRSVKLGGEGYSSLSSYLTEELEV